MGILQQNTAYVRMYYLGQTGLTPAFQISKNGGAFADPAGGAAAATEVGGGWYKFALQAADTDTLGDLAYTFGAGLMNAEFRDQVTAGTVGDVTLAASQPNYAPAKAGDAMTLTGAYDAAKNAAAPGAAMALTGLYDAAKTAAQPGDQMTLTLAAMQGFFLTNTGKVYAQAIPGSVVHETAAGAGGGSGDPLANAVPGMYAIGTAGYALGQVIPGAINALTYQLARQGAIPRA